MLFRQNVPGHGPALTSRLRKFSDLADWYHVQTSLWFSPVVFGSLRRHKVWRRLRIREMSGPRTQLSPSPDARLQEDAIQG